MSRILTIIVALFLIVAPTRAAMAVPMQVADRLPGAQAVGHGTGTYMMMDVYDAVLYAPNGRWMPRSPLALSLTYHMNLKGKAIADRSIREMRAQGFTDQARLDEWRKQMTTIFPDVAKGTNLTGVRTPSGETEFFENGAFIGRIKDQDFGKRFFDIWLGQNTTDSDLRNQLVNAGGTP